MEEQSELLSALRRAQRPGEDPTGILLELGGVVVQTAVEANGVCEALSALDAPIVTPCGKTVELPSTDAVTTPLTLLASLFQRVGSEEALEVLGREGVPLLVQLFDRRAALAIDHPDRREGDLLFLLKIMVMYRSEAGLERVVAAARAGLQADDFLWEVIFQQVDSDHPYRRSLLWELSEPLPRGFTAVAYLDYANAMCLCGEIDRHPFDADPGVKLLEGWLLDAEPERYSYAHSATASLPFVSRPARDGLLALALDHAHSRVQLEAAWASSRVGSAGGIKLLGRHCLVSATSRVARAYLQELDREDAIPAAAFDPDFCAEAELCDWLAHPNEFGRPPETIELRDTRTLFWPPTDDERQLWLFEYSFPEDGNGAGSPKRGLGLVGSITFALYGETAPELPPEDVYALHCCWELEVNQDPRAPEKRSVEAGRRLLAGE